MTQPQLRRMDNNSLFENSVASITKENFDPNEISCSKIFQNQSKCNYGFKHGLGSLSVSLTEFLIRGVSSKAG